MKQADLGLDLSAKRTRKREFLDEMERVVPWDRLVALIEPHYGTKGKASGVGRPPFELQTMLRIHYLQQWFALSDPAMEEALFDVPLFREFAQLPTGVTRLPDESTILRFRHLLEKHNLAAQMLAAVNDTLRAKGLLLKAGTVVDATLIAAPSSTKNSTGERDPEMHQVKKGNQWHFGMKAHIGADRDSGLVHTVVGTAANVDVHPKVPLIAFLGLVHLRIALPGVVLCGAGSGDQGRINDRALLHRHTAVLEVGLHRLKDLNAKIVLLQQVAERQDRGLIRNPVADQVDPDETAHGGHLDQRLFNAWVAEQIPLLHQMDS